MVPKGPVWILETVMPHLGEQFRSIFWGTGELASLGQASSEDRALYSVQTMVQGALPRGLLTQQIQCGWSWSV